MSDSRQVRLRTWLGVLALVLGLLLGFGLFTSRASAGPPIGGGSGMAQAQGKSGSSGIATGDPKTALSSNELVGSQTGKDNGKARPFAWLDRAPMIIGRDRHAVASTGSLLYVIGGEVWTGSAYTRTTAMESYDPVANTYTSLAAIPSAYSNIEACAMNGKIYVPGGYAGVGPPFSGIFYIYDIASNTWGTGPTVPGTPRLWYSAVCDASANKLYMIGGYDGVGGTANNDIYDATAGTWGSGAAMPDMHYGSEGVLIGGNIYIALGSVGGVASTELLKYDILANTWTPMTSAPAGQDGLYAASGAGPDGKLYVAGGGFGTGGTYLSRAMRYDPVGNSWAMIDPLNVAVQHTNGGFAGGFLYDLGGGAGTITARCPGSTAGICNYTAQFDEFAATNTPTVTNTPTNTGTPTVTRTSTPTLTCTPEGYTVTEATATIEAGGSDIGNHCDDCTTLITLPFTVNIYGQPFTGARASSNGALQFVSNSTSFSNACLPTSTFNRTILPYWDDLRTDGAGGAAGIFTSTTGSPGSQVFNIEWRACIRTAAVCAQVDTVFEVHLFEGSNQFEVAYGPSVQSGQGATSGVTKDITTYTQYSCNNASLTNGKSVIYTYVLGDCPTVTPTFTLTPTLTRTPTLTPTLTNTPFCTPDAYTIATGTATIEAGTVDTGNHTDDGTTFISLPFPFTFYQQVFNGANISSNGNLQFTSNSNSLGNVCLPTATFNNAIMPNWNDLRTDQVSTTCAGYGGVGCGVFTSLTGSSPNQVFNIEWRAVDFSPNTNLVHFEIRLHENGQIEMVYGQMDGGGSSSTVGVQNGTGGAGFGYTQFECNTAGSLTNGLQLMYTFALGNCPTLTPTQTFTPSNTPTLTNTATLTNTPACAPDAYSFATSTATIEAGTNLVPGSQGDDQTAAIAFPFPVRFYDLSYTSARVSTNGNLQFVSNNATYINACLPAAGIDDTIFAYWDDLYTGDLATQGIYTSVTGSSPNQVYNVEWRANLCCSTGMVLNFEIRFYEGQTFFDVVYGALGTNTGSGATIGVQDSNLGGNPVFTQYSCNTASVTSGLQIRYSLTPGNCATRTATPTPAPPPCGAWTLQAPYPIPVLDNAVASQGGKVYSFGGVSGGALPTTSYVYDPAANTWTLIAPLPAGREQASAVSDGTYIYILGGADSLGANTSTIWRYDPATNTYNTALPNYTVATWAQAVAYLNGKVYKIAGCGANCTTSVADVEVFDIATSTWSAAAPLPQPLGWLMAIGMNGYVYTAGGTVPVDSAKTYRYDPATNTWDDAAIADLPVTRWGSATDAYAGGWLLSGGYVSGAVSTSAVKWDPAANTWTEYGPMVNPRARMGGAAAAGAYYNVGGREPGGAFTGNVDNQRILCAPTTTTLIGHVTYQGIPQPNVRNNQAVTVTLCVNGLGQDFVRTTDTQGFFTITLTTLNPSNTYNYKVKSYKNLANAGIGLSLPPGATTSVEFGLLKAGDANNNNLVNSVDFNLLKNAFGTANNPFTDFDNSGITNATDFNLQKGNFGVPGQNITCP